MQSNGDKAKVPAPMVSFEDTSEAYEAGYRDGMKAAKGGAIEVVEVMRKYKEYMKWKESKPEWTEGDVFTLEWFISLGRLRYDEDMRVVEVE